MPAMYYPIFNYIKKEDALNILKRRNIYGGVMGIAIAIVFGVMEWVMGPKLSDYYMTANIPLPLYARTSARLVILTISILTIIMTKPESEQEIKQKLRQYKPGEMILINNLINTRYELTIFSILGIAIIGIIMTIVLPIYSLTSSF